MRSELFQVTRDTSFTAPISSICLSRRGKRRPGSAHLERMQFPRFNVEPSNGGANRSSDEPAMSSCEPCRRCGSSRKGISQRIYTVRNLSSLDGSAPGDLTCSRGAGIGPRIPARSGPSPCQPDGGPLSLRRIDVRVVSRPLVFRRRFRGRWTRLIVPKRLASGSLMPTKLASQGAHKAGRCRPLSVAVDRIAP